MDSQLVVSSIWEDEDLFEVRILASNGKFSGEADCYTNREKILELANMLESFPKSLSDSFEFTSGESEEVSYFSLSGRTVDGSGHISISVTIVHNETYNFSTRENYKAIFDIDVEPQAINTFGRQLKRLAAEPIGKLKASINNAI